MEARNPTEIFIGALVILRYALTLFASLNEIAADSVSGTKRQAHKWPNDSSNRIKEEKRHRREFRWRFKQEPYRMPFQHATTTLPPMRKYSQVPYPLSAFKKSNKYGRAAGQPSRWLTGELT